MARAPYHEIRQVNLSTLIRGPSTSVGAIVGWSKKGKEDDYVLITSTKQFIEEYGEPEPGNYFHYSALAFLQQSNALYAVRALNSNDATLYGGIEVFEDGASPSATPFAAGEVDPTQHGSGDWNFLIVGDNPGAWNNSIKVKIPSARIDASAYTFRIEVYYLDSGSGEYLLVEEFDVSRVALKKDGFGRAMYLEDVINDNSKYIRVVDNTDVAETVVPEAIDSALAFTGGVDGIAAVAADIVSAWGLFANRDALTVNILIAGGQTDPAVVNEMVNDVAAARGDCVAVLDTPYSENSPVEAVAWRATLTGITSGSYAALYYPWVKDIDEYNDKKVELPPSGYVAAVYAKTDRVANYWNAPYGYTRGILPVIGLVDEVNAAEADLLFDDQINSIQLKPGIGVVVIGERTLTSAESALSAVHVQRTLARDTTAVRDRLGIFLGEPNTEFVRTQVKEVLDAYYRPLVAKGAYYDVLIVCDESNNDDASIDLNELHIDIYKQPTRTIDYIKTTLVITRTGINLQELASGAVL